MDISILPEAPYMLKLRDGRGTGPSANVGARAVALAFVGSMGQVIIREGFDEHDREAVVALLREYETGIGISLCFQGFDAELASLPGDYVPPHGAMLLAREAADGSLLGCVALRAVRGTPSLCEIKRLYVRPAARGGGLGRKLARAALVEAERLGYTRVCLDTLPTMTAAQDLYCALGFRQTGVSATQPSVLLFELDLAASQ